MNIAKPENTPTLRDIRERKAIRKKKLEASLQTIVKQLKQMGALKIVLFGSFAEGDVHSWSDLDIICIMPSTHSGKEWMRRIYDEVDRDVDCDILAYTSEEFEKTLPISRFLRYAIKTGRIIYERGQ